MVTRIRKGATPHLYISEHMADKGLSDAKLGARMAVSATTVWRWKNEQWRLRPAKIAALAYHIGLDRWEDLTLPPGRESIDATLKDAPENVYEAVRDMARKLAGRAS